MKDNINQICKKIKLKNINLNYRNKKTYYNNIVNKINS